MIINKELIKKCIKYYNNFKISQKINLFGNLKCKLLKSNEYNVWIENLANLYILAFSMAKTENYWELVGQTLVEELNSLVYKKYEEKLQCSSSYLYCSWNLMGDTVISKMENILEEKKC